MKNCHEKKGHESIFKYKVVFFTGDSPPLTRGVTCSKFQRYEENISDKKLSVKHAPKLSMRLNATTTTTIVTSQATKMREKIDNNNKMTVTIAFVKTKKLLRWQNL